MTRTVGEVAARMAAAFQLTKAAGWDPVGLQFGDPAARAEQIAVCHEVTPRVTARLIAEQVDLAIVYHPLLFRPATSLVAGDTPSGRAFRLIAGGVALAVVHTAFDVMPGGAADALAAALELGDTSGFGPVWGDDTVKVITFAPVEAVDSIAGAMAAAGAGRIGSYTGCSYRSLGTGAFRPEPVASPVVGEKGEMNYEPEARVEMIAPADRVEAVVAALVRAHPYEESAYDVVETKSNAGFVGRVGKLAAATTVTDFAGVVRERLGGVVRVAGAGAVETVAVIPGSGGSFADSVAADVIVTGDISHHQARSATAAGIAVIDPGHAVTERPGVKALYAAVRESLGSAIDLTDVDVDPWKEQ